jgi:hypothetical protein
MVICRSHKLLISSAPMGSLSGTLPGSHTRLLVVHSKRCPTAGLKLPVGRHNEQQERRENRRMTRQAEVVEVFAELEIEGSIRSSALAAWQVRVEGRYEATLPSLKSLLKWQLTLVT